MKKLILIDGNSIMYRAYYGTANSNLIKTKTGEYTNCIYTFSNMLQSILELDFSNILIAFDKGHHTFRHEIYKDYKAGRSPMPEEFRSQIPNLKHMIDLMGVKRYETDLYEADDIIGTISKEAEENGYLVEIYTSDKDLLQLVSENVIVKMCRKGITDVEIFTIEHIKEVYNLNNKQMIDLKALMGDPSDNLPGIPGVGEKTAIKLLNEYGTLENILNNVENITGKLKDKIKDGRDMALLCQKMCTINRFAPLDITLNDTKLEEQKQEELIDFYQKMEFHSFLKKMKVTPIQKDFSYKVIDSLDEYLISDSSIIIDLDNTNYHKANIIGFGLSNKLGNFYFNLDAALSSFSFGNFLADEKISKNIFDYKKCYVILNRYGFELNGVCFDMLLAAYIANPLIAKEDFKIIADNFNYNGLEYDENIYGKTLKKIQYGPILEEHIAKKAFALKNLKEPILKSLKENDELDLYTEIELPLAKVLAKMEITGMKVNLDELNKQRDSLIDKIKIKEEEIYHYIGKEFNINSPRQLGEILFDYLKLPIVGKNKTGYKTDQETLEKLINDHPVISSIIDYRALNKIYSTYIEGIKNVIFEDSKVHTIFKQALTQTGRLSSIEPNIQNIPIKTELGREIRKMFVPANDYLLSADYSQIELRVLAHMANERILVEAFKNGEDIHERTAKAVFGIDEVSKEYRRKAKVVNFGIIYGMSAWGLSEGVNMTPYEAKKFIEKYFQTFPGIKVFMDNLVLEAKEKGYVLTIMNRRRYIPELKSNIYMQREFGKRTAMNAPIQGSAADIIKKAMIEIDLEMDKRHLKSKLISQVHDELIFDCVSEELDTMVSLVKKIMENTVKLEVPLKIEYGYGKNWWEVK